MAVAIGNRQRCNGARHTSDAGLSTRGLAENESTRVAEDNRLGVGVDRRDGVARGALDIDKVRVWRLHETLEFVRPGLGGGRGIQKIHSELLRDELFFVLSKKPRSKALFKWRNSKDPPESFDYKPKTLTVILFFFFFFLLTIC